MKKRNIVLGILLVITLITLGITSSGTFAWYKFDKEETVEGAMGIVEAEVNGSRGYRTYGMGSNTSLTKDFDIDNSSNIDSFVRIGYAVVYGTSQGGEKLINSAETKISNSNMRSSMGKNISSLINESTSAGGATKQFIYPMGYVNNRHAYFKLAPGENIVGSFVVNGVDTTEQMPDIIVTVETIQATKKALTEAAAYGWDVTRFE